MSKLAHLNLASPLVLAPLAGYSDLPFRLLCKEFGAGLCVSEMISCHGLVYNQKKTIAMLASVPEERPVSFQLFGADPYMMAKATDILNGFGPDMIDINMGCPVKKVTKKGAGAALMATPRLAQEIIQEVVGQSDVPVSVKFRKGVDSQSITCLDFAKMAEDAGAAVLTVHGRTWSQGFSGFSDWNCIAEVKRAVSLPVIGNGDITSYDQALEKLGLAQCDAVMVGRGALGNPWVFSHMGRPNDIYSILKGVIRHLDLMKQHLEVERLLAMVKNHIGRYFKNLKGSSKLRRQVYESDSFTSLYAMISEIAGN